MAVLLPGATIGILGNGQLGRMLAMAAQRMGYFVHVFGPDADSPAAQVAAHATCAAYDDQEALSKFADSCDVVTFEFENIPVSSLEAVLKTTLCHPSPQVLRTFQHRIREKIFLSEAGIACAPFRLVEKSSQLDKAVEEIGLPAVLKTAGFGYDGKGQKKLRNKDDVKAAIIDWPNMESVLEKFVDFEKEVSVIAARSSSGEFCCFDVIENLHTNHILDVSFIPGAVSEDIRKEAVKVARKISETSNLVGTFCVEFFLTKDQTLLVNEIAPRVHNSGHLTIESSETSQFEQHIRAICGLKLGAANTIRLTAMANLLGDIWKDKEPAWEKVFAMPQVSLHLYGKKQAKPGRKMGHICAWADKTSKACELVRSARGALTSQL